MHFVRLSLEKKKRMNISLGEQISALSWINGTKNTVLLNHNFCSGKVGYSDDGDEGKYGEGKENAHIG